MIREALKKSKFAPKHIARPKNIPSEARPVWVDEVMATTGLDMIKVRKYRAMEEWLLLAPTGVPIISVVGTFDLVQSTKKIANPASVLQGLTNLQIGQRKAKNTKKRKLD